MNIIILQLSRGYETGERGNKERGRETMLLFDAAAEVPQVLNHNDDECGGW